MATPRIPSLHYASEAELLQLAGVLFTLQLLIEPTISNAQGVLLNLILPGFVWVAWFCVCLTKILSTDSYWQCSRVDCGVMVFLTLVGISLIVHTPRLESFRMGLPWIVFLLGYFVTRSLSERWKSTSYWIHLGCVAALWGSLDAIYQYYIGLDRSREWLLNTLEGQSFLQQFSETERILFLSRLQTQRAYGNFLLPNFLAGYLALWIPILLGLLWDNRSEKKAFLVGVTALSVLCVALFLSKSRGGWLSLAIVLFFWLAYFSKLARRSLKILFWLGLFGGVIFFYLVYYHYLVLPPSLAFIENGVQSFGVRLTFWEVGWKMWLEYPWGVGINNFAEHYFRLKPPYAGETKFAHNNFLQLLNELSLLGLIVFVWIFWKGLRPEKKELASASEKPASFRYGACCIGVAYMLSDFLKGGTVEDAVQVFFQVFSVLILVGFYHQLRSLYRIGEGVFCGIQLGLIVFLVHSVVDFDLYVFALFQQIFWLLALVKHPVHSFSWTRSSRLFLIVVIAGTFFFYFGFGIFAEVQREIRKSLGIQTLTFLRNAQQELKLQPGKAKQFSLEELESWVQKGLEAYEQALAIFPQEVSLYMDQAFLLETASTLLESLHPYQLAEKQSLWRSAILNQTERTIQILEKAGEYSYSAEPFLHLAEMHKRYAQRKFSSPSESYRQHLKQYVVQALLRAIERYPVRPRTHLQLGMIYEEIQETHLAQKTLETALQLSVQAWNQEEHFTAFEEKQIQELLKKTTK